MGTELRFVSPLLLMDYVPVRDRIEPSSGGLKGDPLSLR
jgi:hypothetical protein